MTVHTTPPQYTTRIVVVLKAWTTTRVNARGMVYITPPEAMPHYHYDTPQVITVGENVPQSTKRVTAPEQHTAAAHKVCESTNAYRMKTSSMGVEEVPSRSAPVVHHNGKNMSATQITAAVPRTTTPFFVRRAQTTFV